MRQIIDLHIHSRYSRACSSELTLVNIALTCEKKGVDIVGTGDFTYPAWFKSIKEELVETKNNSGLYKLKKIKNKVKFILSSEVSLIYKDNSKVRRIHLVLHAPSIDAAEKLNKVLDKKYNIRSDGRPILGVSAPDFVKLVLNIDKKFIVYPAHIWTPWFSVFGSKSGFDSLEECFHEEVKNIYAIETGLSSDPEMNWRISALDNLTILSSSDAHSLNSLGREATIMEFIGEATYQKIYDNIKNQKGIESTIEFYPEEGMYHFDGHRTCKFSCTPLKSIRLKNSCPKCHKPLTIGVLSRVEELADRPLGYKSSKLVPFKKLVELDKIIAEAYGLKNRRALKVKREYERLIVEFGSELYILLEVDLDKLAEKTERKIVEGIKRVRNGKLIIKPGYDGEYGVINIFSSKDKFNK